MINLSQLISIKINYNNKILSLNNKISSHILYLVRRHWIGEIKNN